jgi:transposase
VASRERRDRCLATIPGIGPITATAIVATVSNAARFKPHSPDEAAILSALETVLR